MHEQPCRIIQKVQEYDCPETAGPVIYPTEETSEAYCRNGLPHIKMHKPEHEGGPQNRHKRPHSMQQTSKNQATTEKFLEKRGEYGYLDESPEYGIAVYVFRCFPEPLRRFNSPGQRVKHEYERKKSRYQQQKEKDGTDPSEAGGIDIYRQTGQVFGHGFAALIPGIKQRGQESDGIQQGASPCGSPCLSGIKGQKQQNRQELPEYEQKEQYPAPVHVGQEIIRSFKHPYNFFQRYGIYSNFVIMTSGRRKDNTDRPTPRWLKAVRNKYFIVTVCFLAVLFAGKNNIFRLCSDYIKVLRQEKVLRQYEKDISAMDERIRELTSDKDSLEKFSREQFYFHKKDEDVFIPERDGASD